jgi:K+-transporting ATPase c subunit
MVAKATGIAPAALQTLISNQTNSAQLGFLGS